MEFLNGDNYKKLYYVFFPRTTYKRYKNEKTGKESFSKKNIIPVGVHELSISSVEIKKSQKKNWDLLYLSIHKKKDIIYEYDTDHDRENIVFDDIVCVHSLSRFPQGKLSDQWFRSFTGCLGRSDFDKMLEWKGKKFKAVVANVQKKIDYGGEVKKDLFGNPLYYWDAVIRSVHKMNEEVKIEDWFELCNYERYDPIEDSKHTYGWFLQKKNTENLFGSIPNEEIPF